MGFASDSMKIGLVVDGETKYLDNIDIEEGTYTVNDEGGAVYSIDEGAPIISKLRKNEPNETFLTIPA